VATAVFRIVRAAGWGVVVVVAVPLCIMLVAALLHGPTPHPANPGDVAPSAGEVLSLSPRQRQIFVRTIAIAVGAVAGSFLLAAPAVLAAVNSRSAGARSVLYSLMAWPLLAPPSVTAYAWTLAATQKGPLGMFFQHVIGWNRPEMAPLVAAWLHSVWLWPVPALLMTASFSTLGRPAYRLALLDASPRRALLRAALPAMAGPATAAAAIVFMLSVNDPTLSPLAFVPAWPTEMLTEVVRASRFSSPTAFILWRSWPMLAITAALGGLAIVGLRPMLRRSGVMAVEELGQRSPRARAVFCAAVLTAAFVSLMPMVVFVAEMTSGRTALLDAVQTAWNLYPDERNASLIVAGVAAGLGVVIGTTAMGVRHGGRRQRLVPILVRAFVLSAALPPVVIGQAFVAMFNGTWGPADQWRWALYDNTPVPWIAGVVARYGFLPLMIAWLARRSAQTELSDQALSDGANRAQAATYVQLPAMLRPLAAAGLLLGCLAMSELPVSSMLVPVRFGGSLAVVVDQQIHFGRQDEVVATSLMLTLPAMLVAGIMPWMRAKS